MSPQSAKKAPAKKASKKPEKSEKKEPVKKLVKKVKNDSSYSKFLSQLIQDPLYALSYTQAVEYLTEKVDRMK